MNIHIRAAIERFDVGEVVKLISTSYRLRLPICVAYAGKGREGDFLFAEGLMQKLSGDFIVRYRLEDADAVYPDRSQIRGSFIREEVDSSHPDYDKLNEAFHLARARIMAEKLIQ